MHESTFPNAKTQIPGKPPTPRDATLKFEIRSSKQIQIPKSRRRCHRRAPILAVPGSRSAYQPIASSVASSSSFVQRQSVWLCGRSRNQQENDFLIRLIHEFVLDAGATSIPLSSRRSRLLSCLQYKPDTRGGEARCVQPESSFCLVSMTLLSWGKNTDSHVRSFSRERRSRLSPFDLLVAAKK